MMEEEIVERIRRGQEEFMEKFLEGRLKQEELSAMKRIYDDRKYHALSGKEAHELCQELQKGAKIDKE
jgi:hypothetical protein